MQATSTLASASRATHMNGWVGAGARPRLRRQLRMLLGAALVVTGDSVQIILRHAMHGGHAWPYGC